MKTKCLLLKFLVILIIVSLPVSAQNESGQLSSYTYAQSLQFQRQYYTSPANYLEYSTILNENGTLYSLIVDNYELHCFTNQRGTDVWTKELIPTGHDGDIYIAFIGLTGNNQRVIAYSYNPYFNYGARTSYGYEFWQTTVVLVETMEGWEEKVYYTQLQDSWSYNYALVPFAINTDSEGKVHIILHRRGWWNYGGELHEVIVDYSNEQVNWGTMTQIYKYSEGTVDRGTSWIGRQIIDNEDQHLVYYKQAPSLGTYYIDYAHKVNGVWQTPTRLRTTTKGNYHYFDLDADKGGNYFFMYIENNEPSGPTIWLSKNGINFDNSFTPFMDGDITTKANLYPLNDGSANIIVFLQDQYPKVFNYDGITLKNLDGLTFENTETEELFLGKTFTPMPNYGMLNEEVNALGFSSDNVTTSVSGDITTYYPYDRLFVEVEWNGVSSSIERISKTDEIIIYPNPVTDWMTISNISKGDIVSIYSISGEKVKSHKCFANRINVSDLKGGLYILKKDDTYVRFIKL
ncbi:T9SS type A sorting domain-containing protein [Carboxylicivirga caseinilyticus]|uniref:T9SS type A sorting domain-containing protein n=1 Tax=Carboxylicivirga caseinilyticus TaxID=3417572 RepID=UPI003D34EE2F|nr:T9SS type A sorting domain-containing protein [Marinilabiliaceae bacterium A049]